MDDIRHGPDQSSCKEMGEDWKNWVIVRSIKNTQKLLEMGIVNDMSLDHDMSGEVTGYDLVKWMIDTGNWPTGIITIHSHNPVGAENMQRLIDNATKHGLRKSHGNQQSPEQK